MVVESLRDADLGLLINEHTVIERHNHQLYIAGVEDPWSGRHDMDKTLAGIPSKACTILMSHQPDLFDDAAARSVDLTISGHTHGGQITYPILGHRLSLAMFMTPYIHGHFRKGASQLYVNAGIGFTGPPLRLNAPPEITLYTLVSPA